MAASDPRLVIETLSHHGVAYVLIGGLAAVAQGAPLVTADLDITPQRSKQNLARLADALRELGAQLRVGVDRTLDLPLDDWTFTVGSSWTFSTTAGDVDILLVPTGTEGYGDLIRRAPSLDIDGIVVPVAAIDDIIRMKEAAGRDKDRLALPVLRRLRDRLRQRP